MKRQKRNARLMLLTFERSLILLECVVANARHVEAALHAENSRQRRELADWRRQCESFNRENDELRAQLIRGSKND